MTKRPDEQQADNGEQNSQNAEIGIRQAELLRRAGRGGYPGGKLGVMLRDGSDSWCGVRRACAWRGTCCTCHRMRQGAERDHTKRGNRREHDRPHM
jgi:hypothetical protein